MNSPPQSKMHYEGKGHEKHVRSYLRQRDDDEPETKKIKGDRPSLFCEVCSLTLTSETHAKEHYNGKRHKKNSKKRGSQCPDSSKHFCCNLCGVSTTSQDQLDRHLNGKIHKAKESKLATCDSDKIYNKDFNIYRTPSGQYYCSTCNVSVNSENQFVQHRQSKKHKFNEGKK